MRTDYNAIKKEYVKIMPTLIKIADGIQEELEDRVGNEKNVDRMICRCKTVDSFMKKSEKRSSDGKLKYDVPLKEIQDKIGARIVVYYKSDMERIGAIVAKYFRKLSSK